MLLAEIRRKITSAFACRSCGDETGVDALRAAGVEDGLTSHVFGAFRHLPAEYGAGALFEILGLPPAAGPIDVELWPFRRVSCVRIGESELAEFGCEPDVILESEHAVVLIEAKLGMVLGSDPSQLPREARLVHTIAAGRPWRLLCVTADSREPRLASFASHGGTLALEALTTPAASTRSYFEAEGALGHVGYDPPPEDVAGAVSWMSWNNIATMLAALAERGPCPPSARNLLLDVVALLRQRGLVSPPYRGFHALPSRPIAELSPWRVERSPYVPWASLMRSTLVPPRTFPRVFGLPRPAIFWSSLRPLRAGTALPRLFSRSLQPFVRLSSARLAPWPARGWLQAPSAPSRKEPSP